MIISVTERGTFKRCETQWDLTSRNRRALTPILPPLALSAGSVTHKALEGWLENPEADPQVLALAAAKDFIDTAKAGYLMKVGVLPNEDELAGLYEQLEMVVHMVGNYRDYHGTPLPPEYTLIKAEQTLILPIPGTAHSCRAPGCLVDAGLNLMDVLSGNEKSRSAVKEDCKECGGTGTAMHYLEATLDGVAQDAQGRLWVVEHKTFGKHPNMEHLRTNDQFIAYCWALGQLGLGEVGGILYDGMWKRRLEGRRTMDELFTRTTLVRGVEEMAHFEKELATEAIRMDLVNRGELGLTHNFRWDGCWDCSVAKLCVAEYNDDDTSDILSGYTTREEASWLRDQVSTED